MLFSERHAGFQAAQRSVREVQEKLSTMVQQHSSAQGGESDSRDSPDSQRSADAGDGYLNTFIFTLPALCLN